MTRIYEYSKARSIPSKDVVSVLQKQGFDVSSHMAVLTPEALAYLDALYNPAASQVPSQKQELPPVIPSAEKNKTLSRNDFERKATPEKTLEKKEGIVMRSMTVGDFAVAIHRPVSEVIVTLLKAGVVSAKNQMLPEKVVAQLAAYYEIPLVKPEKSTVTEKSVPAYAGTHQEERLPVVVVIGHVDHGKTTLLDYIRKTRVAAREKGGITQHLGAYEVTARQGSVVFLDTPGHEAFSLMRMRGIKVADIAILVVAADDSIMPQTVEALRHAQSLGLPIIVAINKIDKVTPQQIEKVKQDLAQQNLVPEEWGGQTVCVPISAKFGQGIDDLLDVIILQSQLMELKASLDVPACGYVLESKLEKGRGSVATVICQHGIIKVGDYFRAGAARGRITALIDSEGKRVMSAKPSIPVQVSGFSELPRVGELFEVVSQAESKKTQVSAEPKAGLSMRHSFQENALALIVKTDTLSSQEALLNAINQFSGKVFKELSLVQTGVGAITESDVVLASDTEALVYGFHVKVESNALALAHKLGVSIKTFDIIYKLLEELQEIAEKGRPVKKVSRKIGEATVLKVFDIKNLGVIAGAQVKSGRFTRDGKVVVWRGKYKVGEGAIKSLQRDRKTVKEVHTGFECAFMIEGFTEWQIDDRVECYQEVSEGA